MSYQYEPSKAEQRAATLLREKGWRVDEPSCPECHGMGFTWTGSAWGSPDFGGGSLGTKPCSRGCPVASMFLPVSPISPQSKITVADNGVPCTCPKGNYTGDWICGRHNPTSSTTGVGN